MLGLVASNPNLLVPHFLIHSYLYYKLDHPIISDDAFDSLAKELGAKWDSIVHPHKAAIDPTLLKTGYYLGYPVRVPGAALSLLARFAPPPPKPKRRKPKAPQKQ
ncbi:hypothetical protein M2322_002704 [Rhodoblastus acidophilus]|uniref:DNA ligase LigA-related protein n=1 Tax=Rhodoblastus acidophilus TaxID=1074 RepID=UPI0022243815|nr:hypothetical protein [Rhodoblastus acidophilus]MCW2317150.1 hypothetical protein [Rhodoblastus acidophilus]